MKMQTQLELLASEAVAQKILERERLKSAQLRLRLMELEDKHMCLAPGCRAPVIGKRVFGHCENHLSELEKDWLKDDIESPNWRRPPDDPLEHPIVKAARVAREERELQIAKEMNERKESALHSAQKLVEESGRLEQERSTFLSAKLRQRIDKAYATLMTDDVL